MPSSKSILVVEDETLVAMDMQDTLAEQGHFVTVVNTVAQAEQALKAGGLDLAILDYHLKDGSTEPLMQHLHEIGVPFIICSGTTGRIDQFAGAPLVPKPFQAESLLKAVSDLQAEKGSSPNEREA